MRIGKYLLLKARYSLLKLPLFYKFYPCMCGNDKDSISQNVTIPAWTSPVQSRSCSVVFFFSLSYIPSCFPLPLSLALCHRNTHIYTPLISRLITPMTHIDQVLIHTGQRETERQKEKQKGDGRQTKQGGQEADAK